MTIGIVVGGGAVFGCLGADDSRQAVFLDSVASRFKEEYIACTGDARPVDMKRIILWKQKMDAWTKTAEYAELRRDYQKTVGGAVYPCKLIEWSKQRKHAQEAQETAIVKSLLDSSEATDAAAELRARPASRFDFAEIPFGVSKATFSYFFKRKASVPLLEKGRFLYAEDLPIDGRPFLAAFYFDTANDFYKYEIESEPMPADSLNRVVRPAAEHLVAYFEKILGPPQKSDRVGFYDIKTKELALYKKWETPQNSLNLGFSVFDYHYYAKAVVADKKLMKAGREAEEKGSAE